MLLAAWFTEYTPDLSVRAPVADDEASGRTIATSSDVDSRTRGMEPSLTADGTGWYRDRGPRELLTRAVLTSVWPATALQTIRSENGSRAAGRRSTCSLAGCDQSAACGGHHRGDARGWAARARGAVRRSVGVRAALSPLCGHGARDRAVTPAARRHRRRRAGDVLPRPSAPEYPAAG